MQPANGDFIVLDKVITASSLKGHVGDAKRITIGPTSVLTPSARDFLRSRNVEWSRQSPDAASQSSPARWKAITFASAEVACRALDDMGRTGEASWNHESAGSANAAVRSAVDCLVPGGSGWSGGVRRSGRNDRVPSQSESPGAGGCRQRRPIHRRNLLLLGGQSARHSAKRKDTV